MKIADIKSYIENNKKKFLLMMSSIVIMGGLVAGTLAWLSSMSGPIVNNFIGSNLEIDLAEEAGKDASYQFQMIPGDVITKDPIVTVLEGSEACWLFLQVKESAAQAGGSGIDGRNFKYLNYAIRDDWTPMTQEQIQAAGFPTDATVQYYYRKVGTEGNALAADVPFRILVDDKVTVNYQIVNEELTEGQLTAKPVRISFKPVAVQQLGFPQVTDAGREVSNLFTLAAD